MLLFQTEAVVVFTYEKTQEDELSLKVGEVIQDVVIVSCLHCLAIIIGSLFVRVSTVRGR